MADTLSQKNSLRNKNTDDLYYYLAFSYFYGIGPVRFLALMRYFQSAKKAYEAEKNELTKVIGPNWTEKFIRFREKFDPVKELEELKKKNISVIPIISPFYPRQLKEIADPPICLYARGNINLFYDSASQILSHESLPATMRVLESEKFAYASSLIFFAIVGTRKPTIYGQQIAGKFSRELAENGFVIVSGMAIGIDTVAHKAALDAGGKTIAVLGCGVDVVYPAVNLHLYEQIIKKEGLIISEFPPGTYVEKGLFIARNRIISGLSKGVLVVEGGKDSGALITARYAVDQGREVFAPPAPITSPLSEAPNILLKQGAKLITSIQDIYEELGLKILPKKKEETEKKLNEKEKIIFNLLEKNPLTADEIALSAGISINEVLNIISFLELKGVIEKNSEGKYQIKW